MQKSFNSKPHPSKTKKTKKTPQSKIQKKTRINTHVYAFTPHRTSKKVIDKENTKKNRTKSGILGGYMTKKTKKHDNLIKENGPMSRGMSQVGGR